MLILIIFFTFTLFYFYHLSINANKPNIIKSVGVIFGKDIITNYPFTLSDEQLNHHSLVIGSTGSGKTTTLLNVLNSCCARKMPLIYVDGKGNIDLLYKFISICKSYGSTLKVFGLTECDYQYCSYNPFAYGNFTEWKNKLLALTTKVTNKGQEHFMLLEQNYLGLLCEILYYSKVYVDLEGIIAYLKNEDELLKLAYKTDVSLANRFLDLKQHTKKSDVANILDAFYYSNYGKLFSTYACPQNNVINLLPAIQNNEIILFLLNSASYKQDTSLLGRLIINDINNLGSLLGATNSVVPWYCILDEFGAYATDNLADVLSLQRANGLHTFVGTQSLQSIMHSNMKRSAIELLSNCNNLFIHHLHNYYDIETLIQNTNNMLLKEDIATLSVGQSIICDLRNNIISKIKVFQH